MRFQPSPAHLLALSVAAAAVLTVPLVASATSGSSADPHSRRTDHTESLRQQVIGGQARNVILLLGDGMGDSEITIARNYAVGAAGHLTMDSLPMSGEYTTYSVQRADPSMPDYVPDSAATGTAWSTGHKSYDGAISVLPNGRPIPTLLELAKTAGFRTGDVTTAEIEDATPAVMSAHVTSRDCKGPANMAACPTNDTLNGGAGSIAEQQAVLQPDVLLGGGGAVFDQVVQGGKYAGLTVREQAQSLGTQIVTTADELATAKGDQPILGLFAPVNMDLEWTGPLAVPGGTEPAECTPNSDRDVDQPHLSDMTRKTISILDHQTRQSANGFFLQIEGASIDKQDHAANPCGQIGETVEFDRSIKIALKYQRTHPQTLVVVTADHGHTAQIVEAGSQTPGATATLITHDGAQLEINYATTTYPGSQQHTGTEVRVAAKGPQAANVLGITDQSDLFFTMRRALGLD